MDIYEMLHTGEVLCFYNFLVDGQNPRETGMIQLL